MYQKKYNQQHNGEVITDSNISYIVRDLMTAGKLNYIIKFWNSCGNFLVEREGKTANSTNSKPQLV